MVSRPRSDFPPASFDSTVIDLDHPAAYGAAFADVYDRWYTGGDSPGRGVGGSGRLDAMVDFVAARCPSGLVIELGVGSGRLATPLCRRGLSVIGVDASIPMLARCPSPVARVAADMAILPFAVRGPGPTVLCGFNTIFNLTSRSRLDRLLDSLAAMDATFVVEMINSDLLASGPDRSTGPSPLPVTGPGAQAEASDRGVVVSSTVVDRGEQTVRGRHLTIDDGGVVARPWMLRWVTVEELDTATGAAGLRTAERYADWLETPFRTDSESVVSVFRPAAGADRASLS